MNTLLKTLIAILLVFPTATSAATAVVEVNTADVSINALEGILVLPEGMRISEVETGNSVVSLWVEEPHQKGSAVTFAGITPGGFSGTYPVFTLHGAFTADELTRAHFESVVALKNDGTGERVPVTLSLALAAFIADTEPPEDFRPTIASDPSVFDGKYFLVFAAQDKGSGIKHYEVREGRFGWFRKAGSPYLLSYQRLGRDIYVRAVDNAGNKRMTVVEATIHSAWWESYGLFAILIVMMFAAIAYKKQWLRFTR